MPANIEIEGSERATSTYPAKIAITRIVKRDRAEISVDPPQSLEQISWDKVYVKKMSG
jgi:hypothetical protein